MVSSQEVHVHFGAGKLGIGLVLPILLRLGRPIAVFQRPNVNPDWEKVKSLRKLPVYVNNQHLVTLTCVRDDFDAEELLQLIENNNKEKEKEKCHLFVSTTRLDLLQIILNRAGSFSTAVGPPGEMDVLKGLSLCPSQEGEGEGSSDSGRASTRVRKVFAFENDGTLIERLQKKVNELSVDGHGNNCKCSFEIVPVMCDRICTERIITPTELKVQCESYPGIAVVQEGSSLHTSVFRCYSPPGTGSSGERSRGGGEGRGRRGRKSMIIPEVIVTETDSEQCFYHRRKFLLLNGTHMLMAMMAYINLRNKRVSPEKWASANVQQWWNVEKDTKTREQLNTLRRCRIHQLLEETDEKTLEKLHGTKDRQSIMGTTQSYADLVLDRILDQDTDTVGRLLDISSSSQLFTKHRSRFCDLKHFLTSSSNRRRAQGEEEKEVEEEGLKILRDLQNKFLDAILEFELSTPKGGSQEIFASPFVPPIVVAWHLEKDRSLLQLKRNWEGEGEVTSSSFSSLTSRFEERLATYRHLISDVPTKVSIPTWKRYQRNRKLLEDLFKSFSSSDLFLPPLLPFSFPTETSPPQVVPPVRRR